MLMNLHYFKLKYQHHMPLVATVLDSDILGHIVTLSLLPSISGASTVTELPP